MLMEYPSLMAVQALDSISGLLSLPLEKDVSSAHFLHVRVTFLTLNGHNYSTAGTFLGDDYFCEAGVKNGTALQGVFYPDNAIWDGACCRFGTCCEFNNPPWFCKTLPMPTMDDLEVRICHDESYEDSPVELLELFVQ